jgi:hypothetical protein
MTAIEEFLKRAQVLATSAIAWLTAILAILIAVANELGKFGDVPTWVTKGLASIIAVLTVAVFQVRRVTPVDDSDKGLLPPKGPAVPAGAAALDVQPADRGDITVGVLLRILAMVCFIIVIVIGAGWVTSAVIFAWLGGGLAAWVLSTFVP